MHHMGARFGLVFGGAVLDLGSWVHRRRWWQGRSSNWHLGCTKYIKDLGSAAWDSLDSLT